MRKGRQRNRRQQNRKDRNRSAPPTLLSFAKDKGQQQQSENDENRANQQSRRFHRGRQKRKHGIKPQEKEIRPGDRLDNGGVWRSRWPEGPEVIRAGAEREHDKGREEHVLPNSPRNKRQTVFLGKRVVLLRVC